MYIIQTENLIANYFEQNPTMDSVRLSKIREIKKAIEMNFRKQEIFVVIDFTKESLINMVHISPDIFEWNKNDSISLKSRKELDMQVKWYFNSKIDEKIKDTYLELMKKFKEQA